MGTIVYGNLVELLLKEDIKGKEEIINEAIERFGFPDKQKLSLEIGLQLEIGEKRGFFAKSTDNKYLLLKYNEGAFSRQSFLEFLGRVGENYFKERPWIKKLKDAIEANY